MALATASVASDATQGPGPGTVDAAPQAAPAGSSGSTEITRIARRGGLPPCLATASGSRLHLFVALPREDAAGQRERRIRHFVLHDGTWSRLADVVSPRCEVGCVAAEAMGDGSVLLAWADGPRCTQSEEDAAQGFSPLGHDVWIQQLDATAETPWADPSRVTLPGARASALTHDELAVLASRESVDVFWTDWREMHWLRAILGSEGDFAKTNHRRWAGGTWSETRRIQRRGTFYVNRMSAFLVDGRPHVAWNGDWPRKEVLATSGWRGGEWRPPVVLRKVASGALVLALTASAVRGQVLLAWVESGEVAGTETRQGHVGRLTRDGLEVEAPEALRDVEDLVFVRSGERHELLVQRGRPPDLVGPPPPLELVLVRFDRDGRALGFETVSRGSVQNMLAGVTDAGGATHVFFAEERGDEVAVLEAILHPSGDASDARE